jgi:hypothetical protein
MSIKSWDRIYDELGAHFDVSLFESDFEDWIDAEDLDKIPLFKNDHKAKEVIRNITKGEVTAIISKLQGVCPKCGGEMDLEVWIKFLVDDREDNMVLLSIENEIILDGSRLRVEAIPGFYRGVDIADGLHKLYLRWWFLGGDIYIFCPFINVDCYEYLDQIGNDIQIIYSSMMADEKSRQPFKMIVTRRILSAKYNDTAETRIEKFMSKTERDMSFIPGRPGKGIDFLSESFFGVETVSPKDKAPENYKTYFHGKMYGAVMPYGRAEMVLTSYNYIEYETMQLESLSFVDIDEGTFMKQVYKFKDDPHMKIEKVDL